MISRNSRRELVRAVLGVWYDIYYYLASFGNILMWMVVESELASRLFEMTARFSNRIGKTCAFNRRGLRLYRICHEFNRRGIIFSLAMFRMYIFPWLKELAALCYEHWAYLYFRSHGHIKDLLGGIVEAGVDINPVGHSENNGLSFFKERLSGKITLHGGISTTIA